jgi:hypothetical protein
MAVAVLVEEALGVEADSAVVVECPAAEVPPEAGNKRAGRKLRNP